MMSLPSQLPPSPRVRALRLAAVLTALAMLTASVLGIAYALKPSAEPAPEAGFAAGSALRHGSSSAEGKSLGDTYGNGKIPLDELVRIGPGRYLAPEAAAAFTLLAAGLREAGYAVKVNSAYRSLADQEGLAKRYGLLSEGGTAAVGTSEHGLGISVDMPLSGEALRWMESHAARHGFGNTVAGEPWHWTFVGAR
ncbi:hypothetical protein DQ353_06150 [Arthrobacter sp. AQ5-05]|uniref:M15 family metallopeptidase n=1 Tax=Arthrobacter sp. AQ5-05 TaxID=2184581 RepID=UPI000DCC1A9B|nr:M15 family metallopeptidase [Arthrobacter sp. AQ5-05]RAX50083.1 hypothetical protein DQ353_06150 [Arthrobacter sp. AQ5-05]